MAVHMHRSGIYVEVEKTHVAFMQRAGYVLDSPSELDVKPREPVYETLSPEGSPEDDLLPEDAEVPVDEEDTPKKRGK